MSVFNKPKVTLVGAGPGDPDLLTIKGAKALASADVILYDALANKELLDYAPKRAKKIFVGKRKGIHTCSQDDINEMLVANAFEHGHVVRLKGGDPFIFGRGSEEIVFIESYGIDTELVPGISSSMAVPAYQGISLTQRKVSESFWVLTGTTSQKKLSADIEIAAKSSATVVILMGMGKLHQIVRLFQDQNKGEVPVAIIQNGTTDNERIGVGVVDTIEEIVNDNQLSNPAIIVIGEVVRHSHKLKSIYEEMKNSNQSSPSLLLEIHDME